MLFLLILLFVLEIGYLYLADRYNIIDKPNQRSSHTRVTIRGGGIIFPIAWLLFSAWNGWAYPWFTAGVALIAGVSFADDLRPVAARVRLGVHVVSFTLLFMELGAFQLLPWWAVAAAYVLGIGVINAYNFMDGINGITGMYTLSVLIPLLMYHPTNPVSSAPASVSLFQLLIDLRHPAFNSTPLMFASLFFLISAVLVFGFFNFRKKARCFAGDVGSISIGFILFFLLLFLFLTPDVQTGSPEFRWQYILFLAVYGVDSILTIVYRLWLGENIFEAHRKHLYQYLVNEQRMPHLWIAAAYAVLQLSINLWVCVGISWWAALLLLLGLVGTYYWLHFFAFRRSAVQAG